MNHVPLVTVVRGDPAAVVAQIECETGTVSTVQVFVRITDAGKPTPIEMTRQGDGTYQAIIPIALIRGINRFWYYIDARGMTTPDQAEEGVAQTRWNPVTIVDAVTDGGGAGGGRKVLYSIVGVAGVAGGAVLLEHHNDDGGSGGGTPPPTTTRKPGSNRNDDDDDDDDDDKESNEQPVVIEEVPPPSGCALTGNEGYSVSPGTACDTVTPIDVYVCRTCPNSTIQVTASWGPVVGVAGWNDELCETVAVTLPQPPGVPSISVGQFSIEIRINGLLYTTVPWPDSSYLDCL